MSNIGSKNPSQPFYKPRAGDYLATTSKARMFFSMDNSNNVLRHCWWYTKSTSSRTGESKKGGKPSVGAFEIPSGCVTEAESTELWMGLRFQVNWWASPTRAQNCFQLSCFPDEAWNRGQNLTMALYPEQKVKELDLAPRRALFLLASKAWTTNYQPHSPSQSFGKSSGLILMRVVLYVKRASSSS